MIILFVNAFSELSLISCHFELKTKHRATTALESLDLLDGFSVGWCDVIIEIPFVNPSFQPIVAPNSLLSFKMGSTELRFM